jgi:hypothetical protein
MTIILNAISATAAFLFGVGVIYILLERMVGRLKILHSKFDLYGLQVKDFAFLAIGSFLILAFTSLVLPY